MNIWQGLGTAFQGQQLHERLLQQKLQNRTAQDAAAQEMKRRQAQALIGQALRDVGIQRPQRPASAPAVAAAAAGMPAALSTDIAAAGGAAAPAAATSTQGSPPGVPGAAQNAPAPPMGGQPVGPAPAADQPDDAQAPFAWAKVLDRVRAMPNVDPEVAALAIQEIMPQLDKESDRLSRAQLNQANIDQKNMALLKNLEFRRANSRDVNEQKALDREMRRVIAEMQGANRIAVAGIQGDTQRDVAGIRAAASLEQTLATIGSKEKIAADTLALRKDLGEQTLDLKADEAAKNFLIRTRTLDLREAGMNQQQAQFYAKLEATTAMAKARDETTRRGQDLVYKAKQDVAQGKLDAQRSKAVNAMDAAVVSLDSLATTAEELLNMKGLDRAVGPIDQWLLTIDEDTADFEAKLKTLQSQIGLNAINSMKALSATGGSGLGAVSNFEMQTLQQSLAPLTLGQSAEQFRDSLLKIIDHANGAKNRLYQAYEKEQAGRPTGTGGAGVAVPAPGAAEIDTPADVAGRRDGTVFEMDGKKYTKRGNKSVETP